MSTTDNILGNRDTIFHTSGANESIDKRGYYTLYNRMNGHTVIKETSWFGEGFDRAVGYYDEKGKFHSYEASHLILDADEREFFESDKGRKQALKASQISADKDVLTNDPGSKNLTQEEKDKIISENASITTNKDGVSTIDVTDEEDTGTQDTAQIKEVNPGTRKDFGKGFTYPSTLDPKRQDTIHFSMLEYSPKKLTKGGGLLGSGDRKDRKSIGSVTLPIPNGIKDSDRVEWGSDSMNAGELALASIA